MSISVPPHVQKLLKTTSSISRLKSRNRDHPIVTKASYLPPNKTMGLKANIISAFLLIWNRITQTRAADFVTFNFAIALPIDQKITLLEFL